MKNGLLLMKLMVLFFEKKNNGYKEIDVKKREIKLRVKLIDIVEDGIFLLLKEIDEIDEREKMEERNSLGLDGNVVDKEVYKIKSM